MEAVSGTGKGLSPAPIRRGGKVSCWAHWRRGLVGNVGSCTTAAPPAHGGSSVAQSDIQPLSVSKNKPTPPRTLVLPSPKDPRQNRSVGARFLRSGSTSPGELPDRREPRIQQEHLENLTDCLPGTMLKLNPCVSFPELCIRNGVRTSTSAETPLSTRPGRTRRTVFDVHCWALWKLIVSSEAPNKKFG